MSYSSLLGVATLLYVAVFLGYLAKFLTSKPAFLWILGTVIVAALATHSVGMAVLIAKAGRLPLSNTYETLLLFSWVLTALTLGVERKYGVPTLGAFTFPIVFLLLAVASLPGVSSGIEPLVPSLKSNWLLVHVLTAFLGYAAFAAAFGSSVIYLLSRAFRRAPEAARSQGLFDSVTYRSITFGFPLLTIGIVTGSVWANTCWGRYWGWDPKETWSLVTWIIYAIYLHLRHTTTWGARWSAWAAIVGFLSVIFTYLGVNYVLSGLHDYA